MRNQFQSLTVLRARIGAAVALAALSGSCIADGTPDAPVPSASAWGILSPPKACVIFREYRKTKVGFFVIVVTTKTHSELEVIEATDGYLLEPKKWVEDEASLQELQHRATKDGLRYVKVPDKYTPQQLEAARALCRKENITG